MVGCVLARLVTKVSAPREMERWEEASRLDVDSVKECAGAAEGKVGQEWRVVEWVKTTNRTNVRRWLAPGEGTSVAVKSDRKGGGRRESEGGGRRVRFERTTR